MNDVFDRLPPTTGDLKLEFNDARGCKHWMQLLPLINVVQSQLELRDMMNMLNRSRFPAHERLRMLEVLRSTVAMVQEECAKKYINRPSPLFPGEQSLWQDVITLFEQMATGYLHVLKDAIDGDPTVAEFTPLIHQRVLRYTYFIWREYVVIYRVRPPELMQRMHRLYALAESRGYALDKVKDSQYQLAEHSSCAAAYLQALLLEGANPNLMSVKQILWIDRLVERWTHYTPLEKTPIANLPLEALAVDLASDKPLQLAKNLPASAEVRYLDTLKLAQSLKKRIKLLKQGDTPAQLGLGEDFAAPAAENAMIFLFEQWCEGGAERAFQRYDSRGRVTVVSQIASVHCLLTGQPFVQPEKAEDVSGKAWRDLQMFGHITEQTQKERSDPVEVQTESWEILDQSAMGCRLMRALYQGAKVSHNQLFGLKIGDAPYIVGTVRWLSLTEEHLTVGVRLLPGIPQPIAVRATGLSPTGTNKYVPALRLPAMPALKSPVSLIMPPGWFRPTRILEIYAEPMPQRIRITELIERGPDFERFTFDVL